MPLLNFLLHWLCAIRFILRLEVVRSSNSIWSQTDLWFWEGFENSKGFHIFYSGLSRICCQPTSFPLVFESATHSPSQYGQLAAAQLTPSTVPKLLGRIPCVRRCSCRHMPPVTIHHCTWTGTPCVSCGGIWLNLGAGFWGSKWSRLSLHESNQESSSVK
jgi:hypothetical protein